MGKIIKKRIEYGGSSNSAENIKYDDTKNVKEAINEVDNLLGNTDISAIGDGTVTGGLDALNSNLSTIIRKDVSTELFGDNIKYGSATCIKIGRIVWLHINVSFSNEIPNGTSLGKLPDDLIPYEGFTYGLSPTNPASRASNYFEIDGRGNSFCYASPDANGFYNFCGSYISKS